MLDPGNIRSVLAAKIAGNVTRDINVYDGYVPSLPVAPAVLVTAGTPYVEYVYTYGRPLATLRFEMLVIVPPGPSTDGQRTLDEFVSSGAGHPNSVYDAVMTDPTLGGMLAESLLVTSVEHRGLEQFGDTDVPVWFDTVAIAVEVTQPA